jgi:hypothetical protein
MPSNSCRQQRSTRRSRSTTDCSFPSPRDISCVEETAKTFCLAYDSGVTFVSRFNQVKDILKAEFPTYQSFKPLAKLFSKCYRKGLLELGIATSKKSAQDLKYRLFNKVWPSRNEGNNQRKKKINFNASFVSSPGLGEASSSGSEDTPHNIYFDSYCDFSNGDSTEERSDSEEVRFKQKIVLTCLNVLHCFIYYLCLL